jgi:hypothetical protein
MRLEFCLTHPHQTPVIHQGVRVKLKLNQAIVQLQQMVGISVTFSCCFQRFILWFLNFTYVPLLQVLYNYIDCFIRYEVFLVASGQYSIFWDRVWIAAGLVLNGLWDLWFLQQWECWCSSESWCCVDSYCFGETAPKVETVCVSKMLVFAPHIHMTS